MKKFKKDSPEVLFRHLQRAYVRAVSAEFAHNGLSEIGQPMVLLMLEKHGVDGVIESQRELADLLQVTPATITASLKSMEKLGYILKLNCVNDLRRNRIAITDKGVDAISKIRHVYENIDTGMYYGFTDDERELLSAIYQRAIENLRYIKGHPHTLTEGTKCE